MKLSREASLPDEALPALAVACSASHGRFLPADVLARVKSGEFQVWLAVREGELDGFLLTQILDYPQTRALRIFCCQSVSVNSVDFLPVIKSWLPQLGVIEDWARGLGCTLAEIEAPGTWGRILSRAGSGYEEGHVLLTRGL